MSEQEECTDYLDNLRAKFIHKFIHEEEEADDSDALAHVALSYDALVEIEALELEEEEEL